MHVAAVRQNPRFVRNIAECAAGAVRDTSVDFIGRHVLAGNSVHTGERALALNHRLRRSPSRAGAAEAIRALIETILLEPDGDRVKITLKGDLAGMLSAARDSKRSPETGDLLVQIKLVAGARNRRYLQLWSGAA